jgi:hypothetical protein
MSIDRLGRSLRYTQAIRGPSEVAIKVEVGDTLETLHLGPETPSTLILATTLTQKRQ